MIFNDGDDVQMTFTTLPPTSTYGNSYALSKDGMIFAHTAASASGVSEIRAHVIGLDGRLGTADDMDVIVRQLGLASIDRVVVEGLSDDGMSIYRVAATYTDPSRRAQGPYFYYHDAKLPGISDDVHVVYYLPTIIGAQGVSGLSMTDKAVLVPYAFGTSASSAFLWSGC